jgi:F-type H+-transporting ATPase subunit a
MAADQGHSPLSQFELKKLVEFSFNGYDFSFTNSTLFMLFAIGLSIGLIVLAMRPAAVIPGRLQMLIEYLHNSIASMVEQTAGEKSKAFFPFIFSLFMFIMFCNMLGLIPGGFTVTSHIIINFALAILVFLVITLTGFIRHGFHFLALFVPAGAPMFMAPFLFVIELVSYCVRPFSLSVRLFANMLAGGILLKIFAGMVASMVVAGGVALLLSPLPFILSVALTGFKLFVAALQAYIFSILTAVYLRDALELH